MSHKIAPPHIDYLARDFASFRQLMIDHLSVQVPGWLERAAADQGVALIELLAYAADYLSYYQDAAATETYLGTARLRRSVRRHAQLLDYHLHEGCNARLWAFVEVAGDTVLPKGTLLLTGVEGNRPPAVFARSSADYADTLAQAPVAFETIHTARLYRDHNAITFLNHQDQLDDDALYREYNSISPLNDQDHSVLPAGAISAYLAGDLSNLDVGDVLIIEEVLGPNTGRPQDADPQHRHAVRLTQVERWPENKKTKITWHADDALPFALTVSRTFSDPARRAICVARGNVVLADQGRTIMDEDLPQITYGGRYRPHLRLPGLTFGVPYDHVYARATCSAAATLVQSSAEAMAALELTEIWREPVERTDKAPLLNLKEHPTGSGRFYPTKPWTLRRDLLSSGNLSREYVVEMEEDGLAYLRFGFADGGWQPAVVGATLLATYRIGGGAVGNIGSDAIAYVVIDTEVADPSVLAHIVGARNPLAAVGGTNPERSESARLHAPHAFRTWEPPDGSVDYAAQAFEAQARCVTANDYASIATRHPEVAEAVAELRWTGSWQTAVVYVRRRGRPEDRAFYEELHAFLEPYRMANYDVAVTGPHYVPLDVTLSVYLSSERRAGPVRAELMRALGGPTGFFAPASFGFAQPVHRSRLVACAAAVAGVEWVEVERFCRAGAARNEDHIEIGPLEVARLDITGKQAGVGSFTLNIRGGL